MCLHMLHMLMPMLMMVVSSFACLSFTILLNSLSARTLADDDGAADEVGSDNQRDRCACCTADCEQHVLNSLKKQQMFWSYSSHCFSLTEITDVGNSLFASENQ